MADRISKYIILEDAYYTALDIIETVKRLRPGYRLIGVEEEASEAIRLICNKPPDLIIADTTVGDGNSIEEFKKASIKIPLIFISESSDAYYSAQDLNIITFILKPVLGLDLAKAFDRFDKMIKAK